MSVDRHTPTRQRQRRLLLPAMALAAALVATAPTGVQAARDAAAAVPRVDVVHARPMGTGTLRGSSRTLELPIRTNMVGASWQGTADTVEFRARGAHGGWSRWAPMQVEEDEGPDQRSVEARASGTRRIVAVPLWIGDATELQVRRGSAGSVRDLRLTYLNSTGTATAPDRIVTHLRTSAARVLGAPATGDASAAPTAPAIITREQWGANESLRRGTPSYAGELKGAVIHHTVSANGYTRSQSAALVRGIYAYHVRSNGWNDIGYNFVVDRHGQVFEGRAGGSADNVIGAHTGGFNTATTGIALLGTHTSSTPTASERVALTSLLSWRLDQSHVDPTATMQLTSAGNPKFPAGRPVTVRAVSGHRDLYQTACPGTLAYSVVDSARRAAWMHGGAKFAGVRIATTTHPDGTLASAQVRAHGNQALDYSVTFLRSSDGMPLATRTASGVTLDVAWDGASSIGALRPTEVSLRVEARGVVVVANPLTRPLTAITPQVDLSYGGTSTPLVSPNADGLEDRFTVAYTLNTPASVRFDILDARDTTRTVRTVWASRSAGRGRSLAVWDGRDASGAPVADGRYVARLTATDPVPGRSTDQIEVPFLLSNAVSLPAFYPWLSPNGDGRLERAPLAIGISTAIPVRVRVELQLLGGKVVRTLHDATVASGVLPVSLQPSRTDGVPLRGGIYRVAVIATTPLGDVAAARRFVVDTTRPRVKVTALRGGWLRIRSSEPAIALVRGGRKAALRKGMTSTRRLRGARVLAVRDAAANTTRVRVR